MYKIMIIEDDKVISDSIKQMVQAWGYDAFDVQDFRNVMKEFIEGNPQLVLLDISLPFFNGYHWCEEIRRISKVPIIFLSSTSDNMNIVMAMSLGADDFIAKPFDGSVLIAKIQAMLRRTYDFNNQTNLLEVKGVILNTNDLSLHYKNQKLVLTKNDFRIMQILMENKGKVVSREDIMIHLWDSDTYIDDNTLTVNITRLRKKLEDIGIFNFISTKKGIGYIIEETL